MCPFGNIILLKTSSWDRTVPSVNKGSSDFLFPWYRRYFPSAFLKSECSLEKKKKD